MKTLPRTKVLFTIATAVLAVFVIQACAPFIDIGHGKFGLVIKCPVPILSQKALEKALRMVRHNGVSYHFHLALDNAQSKDYDYGPKIAIKTDKVVVTELAQSLSKDGLTPIGSSLSHHLYSTDPSDIATVLNAINSRAD